MATSQTTNLQLVKYGAGTDNFIRTDYNGNLDKIDQYAGNTNQAIQTLNNKIENRTGSFHCEGVGVAITSSRCDVFFPITGLKTNGTVSITSLGVTNLWAGIQGKDYATVIVTYNTGIVVRLTDSTTNPFTVKGAYYCSADITVS